ncbi:MAG: isoprenyl transferase [Peptococcaceae bacterium]
MNVTLEDIRQKPMPKHIAVIMDGNGRWARSRGLARTAGHRVGVQALKSLIIALDELGIQYLTVYAFSTENWKRPADEINALMELMVEFIDKEIDYLHEKGVRVNPIGDISRLNEKTYERIVFAREKTKENQHIILNVALNYGGRQEIIRATKAICRDVQEQKLCVDDLDEALFSSYLYTAGQPDPDLLIRPSGEMRVSNFLLWQIAYSEFWITNVLWPDFGKEHLWQAIWDYQNRDRRYGGLGEKRS